MRTNCQLLEESLIIWLDYPPAVSSRILSCLFVLLHFSPESFQQLTLLVELVGTHAGRERQIATFFVPCGRTALLLQLYLGVVSQVEGVCQQLLKDQAHQFFHQQVEAKKNMYTEINWISI